MGNGAAETTGKATALQAQSAANALALQQQQFNYGQQVMDPYVQGGKANYLQLQQQSAPGQKYDTYTMQQFLNSPEYALNQTALDRQNQGIEAQSAASGSFGNPAVQNALAQNMQAGLGAQYQQGRNDWLSDYNMLAGRSGAQAAQQVASNAANFGNSAATGMMNSANSIAGNMMTGQQSGYNQLNQSANGMGTLGNQLADYFSDNAGSNNKDSIPPSSSYGYSGGTSTPSYYSGGDY
jgi:hypothetical protein